MRPQRFRGNVFIANLPTGYTDAQLAQAFDSFGMVIAACLARDSTTGETKGHGLVDLAPKGAAERAVKEMNGLEIGGRRIEVRLADPNMSLIVPQKIDSRGRNERGRPPVSRQAVRVEYSAHPRTRRPLQAL
jgi:RNA recognition motif-containing protein